MKIEISRHPRSGVVSASLIDEHGQFVRTIKHLVLHSPTGFEYGYGGSGPSDLARSIIGHMLVTNDPPPALYQAFKWDKIAPLDRSVDTHAFTYEELDEWIAANGVAK